MDFPYTGSSMKTGCLPGERNGPWDAKPLPLQLGDGEGDCKVLLESGELIVRLGIRRRVPFTSLAGVGKADSHALHED